MPGRFFFYIWHKTCYNEQKKGGIAVELSLQPAQGLSLAQQQSMELLQMSTEELAQRVEETLLENPLLEVTAPPKGAPVLVVRGDLPGYRGGRAPEDPVSGFAAQQEEDLIAHVLSQAMGLGLDRETERALELLAQSLDERGYLPEDPGELQRALGLQTLPFQRAWEALRSMEPAGLGARDLADCLALQLERQGQDGLLALEIVAHYLPHVARGQYGHIARQTGRPVKAVQAACDQIRRLDPRPGSAFASKRATVAYAVPDLVVLVTPAGVEIQYQDNILPQLGLSDRYRQMRRETEDPEVQAYLRERLEKARWFLSSIEQRKTTLLRCAAAIVALQPDFFQIEGPGPLRPMTLLDVADQVEMHESTVSRAVRDKYLAFSGRVYPLRYFFSRSVGGVSAREVQRAIQALVQGEDPAKPLSDAAIADALAKRGVEISRRTVAKYRQNLSIGSSTARRQEREKR